MLFSRLSKKNNNQGGDCCMSSRLNTQNKSIGVDAKIDYLLKVNTTEE